MSNPIWTSSFTETFRLFGEVVFSQPFCADNRIAVTHRYARRIDQPIFKVSVGSERKRFINQSVDYSNRAQFVSGSQLFAYAVKSVKSAWDAARGTSAVSFNRIQHATLMKELLVFHEVASRMVGMGNGNMTMQEVSEMKAPYQDVPKVLNLILMSDDGLCVSAEGVKSVEVRGGNKGPDKATVEKIHDMPASKFFNALAILECSGVVELVKEGKGNTPKRVAKVTPQGLRWMGLNA